MLNKRGLTLVEVMIALFIALVVFLALMQTALVGIDANTNNSLRDAAVNIAGDRMDQARNVAFDSLVSDSGDLSSYDCPSGFPSTGEAITRNVRNISMDFCTSLSCLDDDNDCSTDESNSKQVTIRVGWKWKGEPYTHAVSTLRRR